MRVLGGLMALGYSIGTMMKRTSHLWTSVSDGGLTVKFDDVDNLGAFVQVGGWVCGVRACNGGGRGAH